MTIQTYNVYIGDDDYGNPIYSERSYDDGENYTYQEYLDAGTGDADLAGGLLTPDALAAVLGKDNVDYDAWMKEAMTPEAQTAVQKLISSGANSSTIGKLLSGFKTASGAYDWAKIATAGAGLYTLLKGQEGESGGYNVPVPKMDAVRQQIDYSADIARSPGASGRQYFTDPLFVKQGDAASMSAAQDISNAQAQGIATNAFLSGRYDPTSEPAANPYVGKMKMNWNPPATTATTGTTGTTGTTPAAGLAAVPTQEQLMNPNYKVGMASGGIASARYL